MAYPEGKEKLLIDVLLSSDDVFSRCQNILNTAYFSAKYRPAMRFILKYVDDWKALPKFEQVKAETNLEFEKIENITIQHVDAFLHEIENFCKSQALANAVLSAVDLIEQGNYGEVEKRIKEAILVSLQSNIGTNYFENPRDRLLALKNNNGQISTGWKGIDDKLYGGLNRGEMTIIAAPSGGGKSLTLQNLSVNFLEQGLNVVYLSFELSEGLTSMRIDSMISGISSLEIFKRLDDVELKVKMAGKKQGSLYVKQMVQGSRPNDIRAYLKNYEIQTGNRPDVVIVDYLDLLFPNSKKINVSDLYIKDKFVSEELRGLAVEGKFCLLTASQLGRSAVDEQEHSQSMIQGGLSKIQTADNVLTVYASNAMKDRGEYQIQFLKTRSSSGVGSKVMLTYDPDALRLRDASHEFIDVPKSSVVFDNLRNRSKQESKSEPEQKTSSIKSLDDLKALIKR